MSDLITQSQLKSYVGVEHSDSDARIGNLVSFIEGWIKDKTNRSFITSNTVERLHGGGHALVVNNFPIVTINTIKDLNEDSPTDIDSSNYDVWKEKGLIYRKGTSGFERSRRDPQWPRGKARWEVDYDGGYGQQQDDLPENLILDLLEVGAMLYNDPDVTITSRSVGDESASRETKRLMQKTMSKWAGDNKVI